MTRLRVSKVALVGRNAEQLPANLSNAACPPGRGLLRCADLARCAGGTARSRRQSFQFQGLHAGTPCAGPSGGISFAVGFACFNACRQIFAAKIHIARTSRTKKPQTTASR